MNTLTNKPEKNKPKPWSKAVLQAGVEFDLTPLPIVDGKIPPGLRGSLYRNGPGRLGFEKQKVGHWFDGDGAVLGVHFTNKGASGVYRYVKTQGYQQEQKAQKLIFPGYGMVSPGSFLGRFGKSLKNTANTSVTALPDKLLALWEQGQPYALDLKSLETIGIENLGKLSNKLPYSAHPKSEPQTGELFNFGVEYGIKTLLHLYRSSRNGQIKKHSMTPLKGFPMIHDFALAGQYIVFFISPLNLNVLPFLAKLKSYSESLTWQPDLGTQILIFDRNTLKLISRNRTEAWFQWHFANGYTVADGSLIIDFVRYQDFFTNQHLTEMATGLTQTSAPGTFWQARLDPRTGKVISMNQVLDRVCEFPTVVGANVGKISRFTYFSLHKKEVDIGQEWFGSLGRFDHQTENLTEAELGKNRYLVSPVYADNQENCEPGWILTIVFDGDLEQSQVWIFDAEEPNLEPICKLLLPEIIPIGYHGTWRSD